MANLLFKKVDYTVGKLLEDIELGEIGLPDIQRPFVWDNARVRDLFDSMYRGYPVGTLLFWENGFAEGHREIGVGEKQKAPRLLIVDGQQRLTALYAVIHGVPIVDKNFRSKRLRLSFNPLEERFEVTNAATQRNPNWITDISVLWRDGFDMFRFVSDFTQRLEERNPLSEEERVKLQQAISNKLYHLLDYPLTALEISSSTSEQQVSDIFVRINSKGRTLNQADFILTLMSVFWDEGRRTLEAFAREAKTVPQAGQPSPYNPLFQPLPDQLLRVIVALAFRRARLEHVYMILRGKDLQTGEFSEERRDEQFTLLKKAQEYVLDLQNWHEFLNVVRLAGHMHKSLILSEVGMVYNYALWLIGKRDFKVPTRSLRNIMARWFFMTSLTYRYTGSQESQMEQDLAMLRGKSSPEEFIAALEREMAAVLTNDYWQVTLPNNLETAASRTPSQAAFYASLVVLDAKVLYSNMKVRDMLSPDLSSSRKALERHHLFPRSYLRKLGIQDRRDTNQVANFALVEWYDNIDISDKPPAEYAPKYEAEFSASELNTMYRHHALPQGWYNMNYFDFLEERRKLMAATIREGFEQLPKS